MTNPEDTILALAGRASPGPWRPVAKAGNYTEFVHELIVIGNGMDPQEGGDTRGVALSRGDNASYIAALGTYGKLMAAVVKAARASSAAIEDVGLGVSNGIDHLYDAGNDLRLALADLDRG